MLIDGAKSGEGHHVLPGDIGILPPGAPHESIYNDGASYVAISLVPSDVDALFDAEAVDKDIFKKASRYRLPTSLWRDIRRSLVSVVEQVESGASELSPGGADYLQRALQDLVTVGLLRCMPPTQPISVSQNVQLLQDVENYMETAGTRPIHVSELCSTFHVSRRTMHRAFQETIGTGPIAYLQRKRLCAVQAILCRSEPSDTTVSSVALEQGFFELGRFSEYYKSLFGESPSETLRGKVRRS
jgi:AraC family ethanolamine operon transcriptional activator